MTFQCEVDGGPFGATVWRGSAFACTSQEIILTHGEFSQMNGAQGECNSGSIMAHSISVENGSYVSQLNVTFSSDFIDKSVECIYDDNGGNKNTAGSLNITYSVASKQLMSFTKKKRY